jgi:hypothetical protein
MWEVVRDGCVWKEQGSVGAWVGGWSLLQVGAVMLGLRQAHGQLYVPKHGRQLPVQYFCRGGGG